MQLLLLSLSPAAVPAFIDETIGEPDEPIRIGYIEDAAVGMPFADRERAGIEKFGYHVIRIRARDLQIAQFEATLDSVDAVYVAGGESFALMEALRTNGAAQVLADRVRAGLPYIGCSAGSIITGPSITPAELMDDRSAGPNLTTDDGLALIESVIVPHADGKLPPYPRELTQRILDEYGRDYALVPLNDDQALRVSQDAQDVIRSA